MGHIPAELIERAGNHLLDRLFDAIKLPYSTFCDGSVESHKRLCDVLGLEDDRYSAEGLIDLAVGQLEEQGIVVVQQLSSKLADGENDYLIEFTEDGLGRISADFVPSYRDVIL